MERIPISKFKATYLAVLNRVAETRKPVLATRSGKPIAKIVPPASSAAGSWLGSMKGSVAIHGELNAPASERSDWEALR